MEMQKNLKQFFLYLIVGALATLVEWVFFALFNTGLHMHYMVATTIAFAISTFANWLFGRLLVFHGKIRVDRALLMELLKIYLTSIIGLLMNLLIMWITVERFSVDTMLAKMIATGIVFFWNFLVRKLLIYKA